MTATLGKTGGYAATVDSQHLNVTCPSQMFVVSVIAFYDSPRFIQL